MKNKLLITVFTVAVLLLSGCASKPKVTEDTYNGFTTPALVIEVSNGAGAPSWAYNESKAFRNALEAAAEVTLQEGYKYFAIVEPREIANVKGSLRNTAKEIIDYCDPNGAMVLNFAGGNGLHKCGVYNTRARIRVALYNEEQTDFTVFNAQEVLDYLKTNDLYDGNGINMIKRD
jgi:hypothetical protein